MSRAAQRAARLVPRGDRRTVELDLRRPAGLRRSQLLHRLGILGVDWGILEEGRGSRSTFRETWSLAWDPASRFASSSCELRDDDRRRRHGHGRRAGGCRDHPPAGGRSGHDALLADLPGGARAAAEPGDAGGHGARCRRPDGRLVPLASALRYGDVRGSDSSRWPPSSTRWSSACSLGWCERAGADDDAAAAMVGGSSGLDAARWRCSTMPPATSAWPAWSAGRRGRASHGLVCGPGEPAAPRQRAVGRRGGVVAGSEGATRRALPPPTAPVRRGVRRWQRHRAGSRYRPAGDRRLVAVVDDRREVRRCRGAAAAHVRRVRTG